MSSRIDVTLGVGILLFAGWSGYDLERIESHTLVLYTTPALRDVLEKDIVPRFREETGVQVQPIYVAAGEQYNRMRLSGGRPEASLFLHASPLFLEKGYEEGFFEPFEPPNGTHAPHLLESRAIGGARIWMAFAWSPLVSVHRPGPAPDLAAFDGEYGFPHPRLSNNGVYNVAFFDGSSPDAGARALSRTRVQPVNARATIQGVADGSFDVTLGYEAVAQFYIKQGAQVAFSTPLVDGERWTMPAVFCVSLVRNAPHAQAQEFIDFLFTNATQDRLDRFHLRPIPPRGSQDLPGIDNGTHVIDFDWSTWRGLESRLVEYEVTG